LRDERDREGDEALRDERDREGLERSTRRPLDEPRETDGVRLDERLVSTLRVRLGRSVTDERLGAERSARLDEREPKPKPKIVRRVEELGVVIEETPPGSVTGPEAASERDVPASRPVSERPPNVIVTPLDEIVVDGPRASRASRIASTRDEPPASDDRADPDVASLVKTRPSR